MIERVQRPLSLGSEQSALFLLKQLSSVTVPFYTCFFVLLHTTYRGL